MRLFARLQRLQLRRKGRAASRSENFMLRKAGHVQYGDAAGEGFLRQPHKPERLRSCEPIGPGRGAPVDLDFDVGEELRRILHLVDHDRRRVHLQEHGRVAPGKAALRQIVKGHVFAVFRHQPTQNGRLSNLPRAGDQYAGILPRKRDDLLLNVSFDIGHGGPP